MTRGMHPAIIARYAAPHLAFAAQNVRCDAGWRGGIFAADARCKSGGTDIARYNIAHVT
jgi:hypothetical protein